MDDLTEEELLQILRSSPVDRSLFSPEALAGLTQGGLEGIRPSRVNLDLLGEDFQTYKPAGSTGDSWSGRKTTYDVFDPYGVSTGQQAVVSESGLQKGLQDFALQAAPIILSGGTLSSLVNALTPSLGAAGAKIAAQAIISGGIGGLTGGTKGLVRGALTGGLGAVAAPYIGQLGSEAGKLVGGGNFGDIVSGAVQGAGRGAVGAVITGDSVLDAILTGAAGGAASAGTDMLVKGTNSTLGEYLKDVPAPIKNAVLSAASAGILGKDIDKAVVNSFMRDMMGQVKDAVKAGAPGQAASAGYGGADIGDFFDSEREGTPGEYYRGLDNVISEWDEADVMPATYDTAPKTSMSPVEMSQFLEANIDDPGTIETLMQDYFPELYTQRVETTARRGDTGTAPRSIRDVGNVTQIQPGEKLDGTTVVEPDLSKNLPTVQVDKKTTPGKKETQPSKKGLDLDALAFLLGAMNQRPEKEEDYRVANIQPLGYDLMYGLRG